MLTLRESVIEIVPKKLTALGIEIPSDLEISVEEVEHAILNYCNLSQVPAELKFTWVGMVVDLVRWEASTKKASGTESQKSDTPAFLSSLKEGDVTLGFSADTSSAEYQARNAHKLSNALDQVVMNYQDSLNRFRRLVW